MVDFPTSSHSANILDLEITKSEKRILEVCKEPFLRLGDYGNYGLSWKFTLKNETSHFIHRPNNYNFDKGNYHGMNEFFNKFDWEKHFESRDVDNMYSILIEKYFEALGLFLPKRKDETNSPRKKIWWNKDIKNSVKLKRREWNSYKKVGGSLTRNF